MQKEAAAIQEKELGRQTADVYSNCIVSYSKIQISKMYRIVFVFEAGYYVSQAALKLTT